MRRQWTPSETNELVTRFPAEGAAGLALNLGRSVDSICSQARRYGVRSQTRRLRQAHSRAIGCPTVNARFFEQLTPNVAFVLGFVWANGTVRTRHRSVLRLSVDADREDRLQNVLKLMGSRHQVQRHGYRVVVEVCNSRLVHSLIGRFGSPRHSNPKPSIPALPATLIPQFASGFLNAAGYETETVVRWTGHPETVRELQAVIQTSIVVTKPRRTEFGRTVSIAWTDENDIQLIRHWLKPVAINGSWHS